MTNKQLKNLKDRLWQGADQLRANSGLKSTEYATPILGLIFLRFAQSKYNQYENVINAEYDKIKGSHAERPIHEIAIEKCGYYLPDEAKFDYLLNLPESENLAEKTKAAMEEIEKYTAELADTLLKDVYYSVNSEDDPFVLAKLFKVFKDIPTDVNLDIFGEIYEYFLGEFALAEGQGGGEFFTPSTVVRYMVEVLAPTDGEIFELKNNFGAPCMNDILITSVGSIGISFFVDKRVFYFKDGNLTWLQSGSKPELALYIFFWLNSDIGKGSLLSSTIGTSQSALTIENLKRIKLIKPMDMVLSKFNDKVMTLIENKRILQQQSQNLARQRDLLLPRLMSGKLKVN